MNDLFLVVFLPIVVVLLCAIYAAIDKHVDGCWHDYDEWQSWTTEHAYVQQKQCKKCKYIFTYQERKMGHEHHDVHKG